MLYDIKNSVQITDEINNRYQPILDEVTNTCVISHHYWPEDLVQQRISGFEGGDDDDNDDGDDGDTGERENIKRCQDFFPKDVWHYLQLYSESY